MISLAKGVYIDSLLTFFLGKSSSLCCLQAFLNDRTSCLNKNDDDKDQTLECILDIDAEGRNGDDDEVDGCIREGSEEDTKKLSSTTGHVYSSQHYSCNSIHFIALTRGSWCDVSNLTSLKEGCYTNKKTCDHKHRNLDKCSVDT